MMIFSAFLLDTIIINSLLTYKILKYFTMCFDIASWDQFGFNIQLNYRKKNTYGTKIGGICTVGLFIFFWTLAISLIGQIIFWPNYSSLNYTQYDDPGEL